MDNDNYPDPPRTVPAVAANDPNQVATELQAVAAGVDRALTELCGERIGFALVVMSPGGVGVVGNLDPATRAELFRTIVNQHDAATAPRIILPM